ncbi:MAG: GxxExxY protein [Verrucomicrobia bacterium]|nr:MAG: GxxExxY protein [Verrucomicrobiota bacterium]
MIHEELSREIIGAAMEVLNELKPYRGELIGNLIPDLIVDDAVIVDPKVVSCFTDTHVAQMIGYLNITRLDLALLLTFKNARLEWKRVLRPQEPDERNDPDLHT